MVWPPECPAPRKNSTRAPHEAAIEDARVGRQQLSGFVKKPVGRVQRGVSVECYDEATNMSIEVNVAYLHVAYLTKDAADHATRHFLVDEAV